MRILRQRDRSIAKCGWCGCVCMRAEYVAPLAVLLLSYMAWLRSPLASLHTHHSYYSLQYYEARKAGNMAANIIIIQANSKVRSQKRQKAEGPASASQQVSATQKVRASPLVFLAAADFLCHNWASCLFCFGSVYSVLINNRPIILLSTKGLDL